jgi:hypothetical protein
MSDNLKAETMEPPQLAEVLQRSVTNAEPAAPGALL